MANSDRVPRGAKAVLRAAADAIDATRARGVTYADEFSPLHYDGLKAATRRLGILIRGEALGIVDVEAVSPPVFRRHLLVYSTDVDDCRRAFAIRHGMGHVAAGHVAVVNYLQNRDRDDYMKHEERVADLYALADLIPAWQLEELRGVYSTWRALTHEVLRHVRRFTLNWPDERAADRATLRVSLFRTHSL